MIVPLLCPGRIREAKNFLINRYFLGIALFELFFFVPLGAYLYYFYPDWSLMYFVDPGRMDPATRQGVGIAALVCYLGAVKGGFFLSARLVRNQQESTAWLILLGLGLGLGIFSLLTLSRLLQVGSYSDWTAFPRSTTPLYAHRLGYLVGVDAAIAAFILAAMIQVFRRETG